VISITDTETYPTTGRLDLLTVLQKGNPTQSPSWAEVIQAWMDPSQAVLPMNEVFPSGQSTKEVVAEASAMMKSSQQEAIAAALLYQGYKISTHTYIDSIIKGGASEGIIHADDLLLSVDGKKIADLDQLRNVVGAWVGPKPLDIKLMRDGQELNVAVTPKKIDGALRIGVMVGTKYMFPINVTLQLEDVGGPSGGMMFALGIIDELTPGSLTGGFHIAGTGTIQASGIIGPIGGIRQKLYAARDAGATWFLAPAHNCGEVVGHVPSGIRVVKITTLEEAVNSLKSIAAGKNLNKLSKCTAK
jgi:PDZ domain-containing protein